MTSELEREVARRRTFAIITHPDAGKTTLTEKLLLYGGAIHLAGSVKARRARRHATSRLDGAGEGARHLGHLVRAPVRVPGPRGEPARHPGPPGLLRGHLPHARRRGQRGDAHRRGEGRRAADQEALQGLPHARHPHLHLRQQAGPLRPRAAGADGRAGAGARHPRLPDELAHRHGAGVPRRLRPAGQAWCTSSAPRARHGETEVAERRGVAGLAGDHSELLNERELDAAARRTSSCWTWAATRSPARRATRGSSRPMFFG